jgi:hypothetical protein
MRTSILIGSLVGCLATPLAAQIPTGSPQQTPVPNPARTTPPPATGISAPLTITGCLYFERDEYVLAGVTPGGSNGARPASPAATGTSGTVPAAYEVDDIPRDQLRPLTGKRVEVVGRVDTGGDPAPGAAQRDGEITLPEFDATSIKEVAGTCPATREGR